MVVCLAILAVTAADLTLRGNHGVLFVIPTLLLAGLDSRRRQWQGAALMTVLTFADLFIKNYWMPHEPGASAFDFFAERTDAQAAFTRGAFV